MLIKKCLPCLFVCMCWCPRPPSWFILTPWKKHKIIHKKRLFCQDEHDLSLFVSSFFSGSNFWITEMGKSRSFAGSGGDLNPGCFMFQNS